MTGRSTTTGTGARALLVLGLLSALLAGLAVPVSRAQPGSFTPEERRRLLAGELVRRSITRTERGARYFGGTSWERVRAPSDEVWRTVLDIRHYPRLIPGVVEARVVQDDGSDRLVFLRHRYSFIHAAYFVRMHIDQASHTVRFELDRSRPHDVEDGRGFLSVAPFRGDESIVTWGVLADVGSGLVTGMLEPLLYDWILRVPWCVRGKIEAGQPGC